MTWPVSASRTVYENPWIVVTEDTVTRPDGGEGIYGVLTVRNTAVFIVAVTDADEVVLVTIDRHTVGSSTEVPAGGTDGEDPLLAAQRELREEAGLVAADWREIGRMTALNGISRAPEIVYLATGLTTVEDAGAHSQVEEGISVISTVPFARALDMVRDGEITDGETVAALLYAAIALGRVS